MLIFTSYLQKRVLKKAYTCYNFITEINFKKN